MFVGFQPKGTIHPAGPLAEVMLVDDDEPSSYAGWLLIRVGCGRWHTIHRIMPSDRQAVAVAKAREDQGQAFQAALCELVEHTSRLMDAVAPLLDSRDFRAYDPVQVQQQVNAIGKLYDEWQKNPVLMRTIKG